ncbi:hypothetical protein [Dactylosporangium cerinum]
MGDADSERRSALMAAQLAAVWAIGAVGLPVAAGLVFLAAYTSGTGALGVGLLVALAGFVGLLWLTVRGTAAASVLGGTTAGQVVWALLVAVAGGVLWGAGWALSDDPSGMLGKGGSLVLLANGLPFVAVAGLLLRGWWARLATIGIVGVVAAAMLAAPGRSGPPELSERLDQARLDRDSLFLVSIPGYHPSSDRFGDDLGTGVFMPTDPRAIPVARWITIVAFDRATAVKQSGGCGQGCRARSSRPRHAPWNPTDGSTVTPAWSTATRSRPGRTWSSCPGPGPCRGSSCGPRRRRCAR